MYRVDRTPRIKADKSLKLFLPKMFIPKSKIGMIIIKCNEINKDIPQMKPILKKTLMV